jgi:hypothetical protein
VRSRRKQIDGARDEPVAESQPPVGSAHCRRRLHQQTDSLFSSWFHSDCPQKAAQARARTRGDIQNARRSSRPARGYPLSSV